MLGLAVSCSSGDRETPLIFAAASLADVLEEAAAAYETETGKKVEFNFGGSTALANQVSRLNAPADGVILAGDGPVQELERAGVVGSAGVQIVARNSLVVVSRDGEQLAGLNTLADANSRVAIADPALAPAGQYAREALVSAGVWDALEKRIIPTLDVRAALAAAGSGSVGFAIVYATDALTEPGLSVVLSIDEHLHSPVVYQAAAVSRSDAEPSASAFFDFLLGSGGRATFERHGFTSRD